MLHVPEMDMYGREMLINIFKQTMMYCFVNCTFVQLRCIMYIDRNTNPQLIAAICRWKKAIVDSLFW